MTVPGATISYKLRPTTGKSISGSETEFIEKGILPHLDKINNIRHSPTLRSQRYQD